MSVLSKEIHIWKSADCVCFDVDSTVCRNEAIDDLANFIGVGDQVEKMYKIVYYIYFPLPRCLFNQLNYIRLMYSIDPNKISITINLSLYIIFF